MAKPLIINTSFVIDRRPEEIDSELGDILCQQLGMPLEKFVENAISKTEQAIDEKQNWKGIHVRCFRTTRSKVGFCFKSDCVGCRDIPDVILGFNGDTKDFEITLFHELLHLLKWDEKMLELKAVEIYDKGGGLGL